MSHGVKRARQSAEAQEARRLKERSQLKAYLSLSDDVLQRKQANNLTKESFDVTTKMLALNPEFYTAWNYRRSILLKGLFPTLQPAEIYALIQAELALTTAALRQHPKVYWIWNHRQWCLANVPDGPEGAPPEKTWHWEVWARELYIDEKMLDLDARNFHAWNYRRYVLASHPGLSTPQDELSYTKHKIEANFSNFSAWHQRSKVYLSLWENGVSQEERTKVIDEEFDLVKQALYTDPADQSAWLYHRWLIAAADNNVILRREIVGIEELLAIEPDSKWCLETLVHYKGLLLRRDPSAQEERALLISQRDEMLEKLQSIDPQRKRRYIDLKHH